LAGRLISFSNIILAILPDRGPLRSRLSIIRNAGMSTSTTDSDLVAIYNRLCGALGATESLFREVIQKACRRFPSIGQSQKSAQVERFIASRAWTDAALALIELELPLWQVRRVAYDGGEWYCALSRTCGLPDWLDQSVEARHTDLALAVLVAFVEVQRITVPESRPSVPAVPRDPRPLYEPLCSDNFA
jgi:hypothetical protein